MLPEKKVEKRLKCKSFSYCFNKNYQRIFCADSGKRIDQTYPSGVIVGRDMAESLLLLKSDCLYYRQWTSK